jgi:hypothetical protein
MGHQYVLQQVDAGLGAGGRTVVEGGMSFSVDAEGRAMKTLANGLQLHAQKRMYNALA